MFDNVIPIIPERYAGNAIPAITTKEDHDASLAGNLNRDRSPIQYHIRSPGHRTRLTHWRSTEITISRGIPTQNESSILR